MAVDTRNKRASAISVGRPWTLVPPAPDGTVADADRKHVAFSYAGISATAALVARARVTVTGPGVGIIVTAPRSGPSVTAPSSGVTVRE